MFVLDAFYKSVDFPKRLHFFVKNYLSHKSVFSTSNRSDSDSTLYTNFVASTILNEKKLNKFRTDYRYRLILEHVDFKLGYKYQRLLTPATFDFYRMNPTLFNLSKVGSPRIFYYAKLIVVYNLDVLYMFLILNNFL